MFLNIKNNAIFVADSHYNENRDEFLIFLKQLKNLDIKTEQLFLMGDMFDFISSESKYFVKKNRELIDLINEISKDVEIIYLEGNHDYNMQPLFKNVTVYRRENQPVIAQYGNFTVQLSHGDVFVPDKLYDIYCSIIRNPTLLKFLNFIDFGNMISKKIYYTLLKKDICTKIDNFKYIVEKRVKHYNADIIIEGHFHQGNEFIIDNKRYKNIPSLTCDKEYIRLVGEAFIGVKL